MFEANGLLMVRDLGSLNGTFVGETRIAEKAMPVKPGEMLTIGPVTFRAEYLPNGPNHGKSSTWETQGPTRDEPLPEGTNPVRDDPGDAPEGRLYSSDDDETEQAPE